MEAVTGTRDIGDTEAMSRGFPQIVQLQRIHIEQISPAVLLLLISTIISWRT